MVYLVQMYVSPLQYSYHFLCDSLLFSYSYFPDIWDIFFVVQVAMDKEAVAMVEVVVAVTGVKSPSAFERSYR